MKLHLTLKQPITNWTEFQRRIKHLLAVRLELETVFEWMAESLKEKHLQLIETVAQIESDVPSYGQYFWLLDQDIMKHGIQPSLVHKTEQIIKDLDVRILEVLDTVANERSDVPLVELKKQINKILRNCYDHIICLCPWVGKITGGPMLPQQVITVKTEHGLTEMIGNFEFSILGAREMDMKWMSDLKFPALTKNAQLWIQHGARRQETKN